MISVIGLGYVGLPLAVAFAEKGRKVVGIDINLKRIEELKNGFDRTNEVESSRLKLAMKFLTFSSDIMDAKDCKYFIIAVPTPITKEKIPDLTPVINASENIAKVIKKGDTVILESTVHPGVTEEVVGKTIEGLSGLKAKYDFRLAYSPERANPGDKVHTLKTITKVVGAQDAETGRDVKNLYELVVNNVFLAKSIKVAEASKFIENTQRDVNIALMNELSIIFDRLGLSIWDVIDAARTKWNFLDFKPGLVGGHCIPVDPYYLIFKSESLGYHPQILTSSRRVSDHMDDYLISKLLFSLNEDGLTLKGLNVLFLGITFKENVPDMRNSMSYRLARKLRDNYGANVTLVDPFAIVDGEKILREIPMGNYDLVVLAVPHSRFLDNSKTILSLNPKLFVDVKGVFRNEKMSCKYLSI